MNKSWWSVSQETFQSFFDLSERRIPRDLIHFGALEAINSGNKFKPRFWVQPHRIRGRSGRASGLFRTFFGLFSDFSADLRSCARSRLIREREKFREMSVGREDAHTVARLPFAQRRARTEDSGVRSAWRKHARRGRASCDPRDPAPPARRAASVVTGSRDSTAAAAARGSSSLAGRASASTSSPRGGRGGPLRAFRVGRGSPVAACTRGARPWSRPLPRDGVAPA